MRTPTLPSLFLLCALLGLNTSVFAQNIALSTQNPTDLYVCGVSQASVSVQNATGSPAATTLRLSVVFPAGVTYEAGSIAGATEFNISNLNAPVFALTDLAGGAAATVTFNLKAGCALVNAINSGVEFSNNITATYAGGSKQLTSNTYIIETGLANLISISPNVVNAMKGDVIMRTIKLRNTRQGPIQSLQFRDQHQSGITIDLQGAVNQNNAASLFTGEIPGSFFTSFGDGDNLLEASDGEITLIEKVTVTNCGIPSFTTNSTVIVGWGCDANICRSDSILAQITILPSNQNPNLTFEPVYARPLSNCGQIASVQEIKITNIGELEAKDVLLDVYSLDTNFLAIDSASFEWSTNGVNWFPANASSAEPVTLPSCDISSYFVSVKVFIPLVQPGTPVRVRYKTYFCQPLCAGLYPRMRFGFLYNKACPQNVSTSGLQDFFPDTSFLQVATGLQFNIGKCLQDDSTYTLTYWAKSQRLKIDTGVLQVILKLPFGFEWDPSCGLNLDGQTSLTPVSTTLEPDGSTTIRGVFDLPFTQDSVSDDICIRYDCKQGLPCEPSVSNVPPRGLDFTVYPPPSDCKGCELKVSLYSVISQNPDDTPECGITACEEFTMVVDDKCNGGGGGGGGGIGGGGGGGDPLIINVDFDSWRVNRGLQDDNNDRRADSNNPANAPGLRLDRFLTGDTLRNELSIAVLSGSLQTVNYRLFLESLVSDFDSLGADEYVLSSAKSLFVNYDTTTFETGRVIIKKANGQVFTCPLPEPTVRSDQHNISVAEPNIRPPAIVDQLASMFDQYDFNVNDYIANGCLPSGFVVTAGDSLFFQADYKFTYNFVPIGTSTPPLINFRTSVCDVTKNYSWQLEDFCTEKPIRQFSGFKEEIQSNAQRIEPCDLSTEISPFQYEIRVARENLFPFEVRPLTKILKYSYSLPAAVALESATLTHLRLQETTPLFANESLTPTYAGDSIFLNLDPFFVNPLDEGYNIQISTQFDTTCGYDGSQFGRTNLALRYANECLNDPVNVNFYILNPNGYQNGSPELDFFNVGSNVLFTPTSDVQLNFTIRNSSVTPALNPWLVIESNNNLTDVELFLIDPPNLIPVPNIGGIYQLDSLPPFAQPFFRLFAKTTSCAAFTVNYRFGWGCSPTFNDQSTSCGQFEGSIEIRPQPPELELIIIKEQTSIPLCTPSADFEFEIANANDGSAFNVVPSVKLPTGMRVVPGSSRLSYPAGVGVPVNMPDPIVLPGNVFQFDPNAASPLLAQTGLVTFEQEPLNAMRILFKIQADCGAVADAQPVYGAEAIQPCGISSNKLRKPGQPIGINGVNPVNSAVVNLSFSNPNTSAACNNIPIELSASIQLDGVPVAGDSIYILLPAGTSYVANSYTPGAFAPNGPPQIFGQLLQLPLLTNLPANTILTFTFKIQYNSPAGCADKIVTLQTREKKQAFCGSTQCDVYVATGESLLNLNAQNPELQLNNFQLQIQANGQTSFTANIENAGTVTASNPVVQLYQDSNGNGQIDTGEPLVTTVNATGTLTPGAFLGVGGNLNLPIGAYCNLIALIPAEANCACTDFVLPLGNNQIVTEGIGLCNVQPVQVGTDSIAGSTYTWQTTAGLSCINCATATFTPNAGVQPGSLVTLVLLEKTGDCVIERRFEIQFGGDFGIIATNPTLCEGESVTLQATAGGLQYNWFGPGITNANQQSQVITPIVGTNVYNVTVTFAGGCTGIGVDTVTVNAVPKITQFRSTCVGIPISIFPNFSTDVPGVYTRTLPASTGCDTLITVTLAVQGGETNSSKALCPGGVVKVFEEDVTVPGVYCQNYTTASGCDSSHCVTVVSVPNPNVPAQDSVVVQVGETIVLDGPSGFEQYNWSPLMDPPTCDTCENYEITPDSTTTFLLVVTDNNRCRDTVEYRVVTCDIDKYLKDIPNAFSPNGDDANDVFRPVPNEGAEMVLLLQVYTRWGTKVYEGRGANAGWNGIIDGKPASSDVYVYILTAECSGIQRKKSGEITLLR